MRDTSHGSTVAHEGYEERSVPATGVEPTRLAVVDYGYWGSRHVRVLRSLPDISVTVVDEDERRLVDAVRTYPSVPQSEPWRRPRPGRCRRRNAASQPRRGRAACAVCWQARPHRQAAGDIGGGRPAQQARISGLAAVLISR